MTAESTKKPLKKKGKRAWVKNAVIVFLAVLLVLTFFSNTIMNYSLPEVAAQYPVSTSITTKIRSTGTVASARSYNATVDETRKVDTVSVKVGDTVKEGQVLLTLVESESDELQTARSEYNTLLLQYQKDMVEKGAMDAATKLSVQQAQDAVKQAQSDLVQAQAYEKSLTSYQTVANSAASDLAEKNAALTTVQANLASLQNRLDTIKTTDSSYVAAQQAYDNAVANQDVASKNQEAASNHLETVNSSASAYYMDPAAYEGDDYSQHYGADGYALTLDANTKAALLQAIADAKSALAAANLAVDTAGQAVASANANLQNVYQTKVQPQEASLNQQIANANQAVSNAQAAVNSAQATSDQAAANLTNFQSQYTGAQTSASAAQTALASAQSALQTQLATVSDTQAQTDYDNELANLGLAAEKQQVEDAKAKVDKLAAKATATEITTKYAGTVSAVNVTSGGSTAAGEPAVVVDLTDQGFTLTAEVTREQAKTLHAGQKAEITNLWGSDASMTLTSIENGKADPANGRVLNFSITGETISVGDSISFSIGDKNANYDMVLPSSAVHEDADGSFVYTVTVKSSPLGNRYAAKKVAVKVLASDEKNSAITGDLTTSDFVITTATTPIETGTQVRIAE